MGLKKRGKKDWMKEGEKKDRKDNVNHGHWKVLFIPAKAQVYCTKIKLELKSNLTGEAEY